MGVLMKDTEKKKAKDDVAKTEEHGITFDGLVRLVATTGPEKLTERSKSGKKNPNDRPPHRRREVASHQQLRPDLRTHAPRPHV